MNRQQQLAEFARELSELHNPQPRTSLGRKASEDEVIYAAWANLALERPEVSREEVERILRKNK